MTKYLSFDPSFILGIADADLQVVGEDIAVAEEQSQVTMWTEFARTSNKVHGSDTPGKAVDRYHRWPADIELMKSLNVTNYRTSVSMARTMTENGEVNEKAIAWYKAFFTALRKANIKIFVTLYHWELPLHIHQKGGWKSAASIEALTRHTQIVKERLGEFIEEYFILNEPWCSTLLSYHLGVHAPGETDLKGALQAAHNMLLAQASSFEVLHAAPSAAKISTVLNLQTAYAATTDKKDLLAASYADGYFNSWFMEPIFNGRYPEHMIELFGAAYPAFSKNELETIKIGNKLHALGINFYKGDVVRFDDQAELKYSSVLNPEGNTNGLGWPIFERPFYPDALYDLLQEVYYRYSAAGLRKIYITENGMAGAPEEVLTDGSDNDKKRIQYLKSHLTEILNAKRRGIPVEAYFLWTFMDNYEWAEGYRPDSCFGVVHVDRKTLTRTPKASARWYAQVLAQRSIEAPKNSW